MKNDAIKLIKALLLLSALSGVSVACSNKPKTIEIKAPQTAQVEKVKPVKVKETKYEKRLRLECSRSSLFGASNASKPQCRSYEKRQQQT